MPNVSPELLAALEAENQDSPNGCWRHAADIQAVADVRRAMLGRHREVVLDEHVIVAFCADPTCVNPWHLIRESHAEHRERLHRRAEAEAREPAERAAARRDDAAWRRMMRRARLRPGANELLFRSEIERVVNMYRHCRVGQLSGRELPPAQRARRLRERAGALERRTRHSYRTSLNDVADLAGIDRQVLADLGWPSDETWEKLLPEIQADGIRRLAAEVAKLPRPGRFDPCLDDLFMRLAFVWRRYTRRRITIERHWQDGAADVEGVRESEFADFVLEVLWWADPGRADGRSLLENVKFLLAFEAEVEWYWSADGEAPLERDTIFTVRNADLPKRRR